MTWKLLGQRAPKRWPLNRILSTEKKGFVMTTKSFIKIGKTKIHNKIFVTTTKYLVLSTKRLVATTKLLVAATKNLFVVPNFVAVTRPFFIVLAQSSL